MSCSYSAEYLRDLIYGDINLDCISCIKDPEHPFTFQELDLFTEDDIYINLLDVHPHVTIYWSPTAPNCSFANNIGLCIKYKLMSDFPHLNLKVDVYIKEGMHSTKRESNYHSVDKQVNDKERVAAALENPAVIQMLNEAIQADIDH